MDKAFVEQKLKEITEKIVKEFQPEKIILFGSWAWGDPGPDSDVDLLVVKESNRPKVEREQELRALLSPLRTALDILVYTPSELETSINRHRNFFIEDIVHNGRTLFTKEGYTISFIHKPAELLI